MTYCLAHAGFGGLRKVRSSWFPLSLAGRQGWDIAKNQLQPCLQFFHHHSFPGGKGALDDFFAGGADQPQIKSDVVQAGDHGRQIFVGDKEMAQVSAAVLAIHKRKAAGIER